MALILYVVRLSAIRLQYIMMEDSMKPRGRIGSHAQSPPEPGRVIAYHGTKSRRKGQDFSRELLEAAQDAPTAELAATGYVGFWFNSGEIRDNPVSPYKSYIAADLDIKNPREFDSLNDLADELSTVIPENFEDWDEVRAAVDKWVDEQKDDGYDGVSLPDEEFGGTSYVVFDPKQIHALPNSSNPQQGGPPVSFEKTK